MDHRERILQAALGEAFVALTLSGASGKTLPRWVRVRVRPVEVKGSRALQFSYFDGKQEVAKNLTHAAARAALDEALAEPFSHVELQSTAGDLHVRITHKGKALVSKGRPSRAEAPSLAHDRAKRRALAEDDPLWRALGMAGKDGRILPRARDKFTQVNEFLRLLDEALDDAGLSGKDVRVVDAGCGLAYLTFAAARHVAGARVVGVDTNEELIAKCSALAREVGADVAFHASAVADYEPETPPDVVLSLHACDTATDEALARGVLWRSRVILAVPCCQHELHKAIASEVFQPVLRHGLLRERLADILTDALRALALRIMGYRVTVCEFVGSEHTAKNLMLRATLGLEPGDRQAVDEYLALKRFWNVTPAIERLLGEAFQRRLGEQP